jgi:2-methylcitrate dehydratase
MAVGALKDGRTAIERCPIKYYPASSAAMGLIDPLISVRSSVRPRDIAKISIEASELTWRIVGGGSSDREEKWNPKSRETADHSLPYIVAVSLLDGDVTLESYSSERLADPAVHALMQVMTVTPRDDLGLHPFEPQLKIELRNGDVINIASSAPVGDRRNPIDNGQLSKKLRQASAGLLSVEASSELEAVLWDLADLKDLDDLTQHYRAIPSGSTQLSGEPVPRS